MEKSKPGRGRPRIGTQVTVTLPPHVIAAIDKRRADDFDARPRAAVIREILARALGVRVNAKR
jgi:hypothetical protein